MHYRRISQLTPFTNFHWHKTKTSELFNCFKSQIIQEHTLKKYTWAYSLNTLTQSPPLEDFFLLLIFFLSNTSLNLILRSMYTTYSGKTEKYNKLPKAWHCGNLCVSLSLPQHSQSQNTLIRAQLMQKCPSLRSLRFAHSALKASTMHTHVRHICSIFQTSQLGFVWLASLKVIISSYFQHWLLH